MKKLEHSSACTSDRDDLRLTMQKTTIAQLGQAKRINRELEMFLERIDRSLEANQITPADFQAITNTYKETKKVKKGIEDYISLMSTNPTEAD